MQIAVTSESYTGHRLRRLRPGGPRWVRHVRRRQTSAKGVTTALAGEFSNNNLYYAGKPGAIWNPASGLGTPDLTALAGAFSSIR
jgi:hypothetical protein